MTKIVRLHTGYLESQSAYRPLTKQMLDALLLACEKQAEGVAFGQKELKKSFTALVNRGYLKCGPIVQNDRFVLSWKVSHEAMSALRDLGIAVDCH